MEGLMLFWAGLEDTWSHFISFYMALVRSHLRYCVQFWALHFQKVIDILVRVPRRAVQIIERLQQGYPIPGLQTGTGLQPIGNRAAQMVIKCTKFHLYMFGIGLHVQNYPLPPPRPPPLPVCGVRKIRDCLTGKHNLWGIWDVQSEEMKMEGRHYSFLIQWGKLQGRWSRTMATEIGVRNNI